MTMADVEEEVRTMKWDFRALSDQAVQIADALPPEDRERLADFVDRVTDAAEDLLTMIQEDETETEEEAVARLTGGLALVRKQLQLLSRELNDLAGGLLPH